MEIGKIYQDWISSIDLAKSRVVRFPSLIFLCGGPVSGNTDEFKSCRDIFHRYIKESNRPFQNSVVLAEKVFNYFKLSAYRDLINFERDLAELSVLTVIFSESPGSIAELGSFAVLKKVQERLLVVMHQDFADNESFIWRGPALYLQNLAKNNGHDDPITIYNWRKGNSEGDILKSEDFSDAEDLAETIELILSKYPKSELFDKDRIGHVMLLMLDLLNVIQLATIDEITRLLDLLSIRRDRRTVDQHLNLLLSLTFADKNRYRHNTYYLSSSKRPWLSFAFKETATNRDLDRWKLKFIEHYSKEEPQKHRALRSHMKLKGLIGD